MKRNDTIVTKPDPIQTLDLETVTGGVYPSDGGEPYRRHSGWPFGFGADGDRTGKVVGPVEVPGAGKPG